MAHVHLQRVFLVTNVKSKASLARLLNIPDQTVGKWDARGISKNGLILCERILGVSPTYILTGKGDAVQFDRYGMMLNEMSIPIRVHLLGLIEEIHKLQCRGGDGE